MQDNQVSTSTRLKQIFFSRKSLLIWGPGAVMVALLLASGSSVGNALQIGLYFWLLMALLAIFFYIVEVGMKGIRKGEKGLRYKLFALIMGGVCLSFALMILYLEGNILLFVASCIAGLALTLYGFGQPGMIERMK